MAPLRIAHRAGVAGQRQIGRSGPGTAAHTAAPGRPAPTMAIALTQSRDERSSHPVPRKTPARRWFALLGNATITFSRWLINRIAGSHSYGSLGVLSAAEINDEGKIRTDGNSSRFWAVRPFANAMARAIAAQGSGHADCRRSRGCTP
jgi:hypothetical protein